MNDAKRVRESPVACRRRDAFTLTAVSIRRPAGVDRSDRRTAPRFRCFREGNAASMVRSFETDRFEIGLSKRLCNLGSKTDVRLGI